MPAELGTPAAPRTSARRSATFASGARVPRVRAEDRRTRAGRPARCPSSGSGGPDGTPSRVPSARRSIFDTTLMDRHQKPVKEAPSACLRGPDALGPAVNSGPRQDDRPRHGEAVPGARRCSRRRPLSARTSVARRPRLALGRWPQREFPWRGEVVDAEAVGERGIDAVRGMDTGYPPRGGFATVHAPREGSCPAVTPLAHLQWCSSTLSRARWPAGCDGDRPTPSCAPHAEDRMRA